MKILIVNSYYYPNMIGGTEQSIKLLAEELEKRGHQILIFTVDSKKSKEQYCLINGVKVERIKGIFLKRRYNKVFYKLMDFYNPFVLKRLYSVISTYSPELIWTNNLFYISPYVWKFIKTNFNIPIVHSIRDIWLYCPRDKYSNDSPICQNILCKTFRNNAKRLSEYVDFAVAPSHALLNHFADSGFFKNAQKEVVYNAIDFDENKTLKIIAERIAQKKESVNYLYIGRLSAQKGIKVLIESFKKFKMPKSNLFICGEGDLKEYVIKSSKKDPRIKYLGYVADDRKDEVFKNSDVLILPSLSFEAFGRVIIEAYKWGMPVIATNIGGIAEVVSNGKTGMLIDLGSDIIKQLVNAFGKMADKHTRDVFAKNVLEELKRFSLKNHIDKMEEIFSSLVFCKH